MKNVLLVMLWIPFCGFPQSPADSIILLDGKASEKRLDTLYYFLLKESIDSDIDLALDYAKHALKYASQNNNHEIEIRSNYAQGSIFIKKGIWDSAEYYLKIARNSSYENNIYHRLPWIYGELGLIFEKKSKFDLAIDNYIESLKYSEKFNNMVQIAAIQNQIGIINLQLENYDEALKFFRKAVDLKNQINISEGILKNYLNIAICLNAQGKYDESLEILLDLSNKCKTCGNCNECLGSTFLINLNNELGLTYQKKGKNELAKEYFHHALTGINSNANFLLPNTYGYLADIFNVENNLDSSLFYLNKSNQAAEQYNDPRALIFNKFLLSEIYEKKQLFKEANTCLREALNIKNITFPTSMIENIRKSYVDYERYQSQQIIEAKEKIIQRNNQLTVLLGLLSILSIITFVFAYKNAAIRKKLNEKLSDEVDQRTHELNTLLYRTSHDLAGPLARMKGLLRLIDAPMNEMETKQYLEGLNLTTEKLGEVIDRLETISKINVTPLKPEKINLENFLDDIIQQSKNGSDLIPDLDIQGDKFFMTDKRLLGHIIKNLLDNSYHHIDRRETDKKIFINILNREKLNILIGDTGTGIMDGHENKIFELFFSGIDKNNRAGIGLYFANIAAKRLGGSVLLKHKRKPTLFEVQIPKNVRPKWS